MRFPLLQPRWLGIHLVAVLAFLVCLTCGYWQFVRAQEPSREVISNPIQDLAEAAPLDDVLQPGEYMPESEANQAVTATGEYDTDTPLLSPALSPEGDKGYYVLVPLITEGDTALTVNRGWVPEQDADAVDDLPPLPEGEVEVTGWLISPQKEQDGYIPVSVPEGQVERIAPAVLVNEWPYRLYEGYLTLAQQDPQGPEATASGPELRRIPPPEPPEEIIWNLQNVSYAAQWVVFGIAVLVFWVSLVRRELNDSGPGDTDNGPHEPGADGDGGGTGAVPADDGHASVAGTP
ncbi:MAG: SURF1 family protein [Nocardiopsaceae bacterium]|nr:SURF1 family protein [Nocardiopsaceae bacterium]